MDETIMKLNVVGASMEKLGIVKFDQLGDQNMLYFRWFWRLAHVS